jgi:hypothetical protein
MLERHGGGRVLPLGILLLALGACEGADIVQPDLVGAPEDGSVLFSQGQSKTALCHYDADNNTYHQITIADPALNAHIAHGDLFPGDPLPDGSGYLDSECVATAITLGTPSFNTTVYGGPTGGYTDVTCPAGAVAVGMEGFYGYYLSHVGWRYWVGQARLQCASLRGDGSLGAVTATANFGAGESFSSTYPFAGSCSAGDMLVGGNGQYATYVARIGGDCASLARILDGMGGSPYAIGPWGLSITAVETPTSFAAPCGPGHVVTGLTGRAGWLADAVGFTCTPVVRQPL